ncbi:cobalt-precorrin 5A hydrolase [Sulfobacillus thermosulfidooxidans]|uniref:cobalt-precorrin 5A hydrolase n=1 Tax=Sulfobacillus thermosulfidooxidans TaxID=28034 RepID=UPI0006B5D3E3|nr:cobalamin biosynthesis protein [Sulfobacillus thermosulfidooxidans]
MRKETWAAVLISRAGLRLIERLRPHKVFDLWVPDRLSDAVLRSIGPTYTYNGPLKDVVREKFHAYDHWIFVMSLGAVVRLIAPILRDKYSDPSVTVLDDAGQYAICLLSCHVRGGNQATYDVAKILQAIPVMTTGSESLGVPALDMIGKEWEWSLDSSAMIPVMSRMMLDNEPIGVIQESGPMHWNYRDYFASRIYHSWTAVPQSVMDEMKGWIWITHRQVSPPHATLNKPILIYHPKVLTVGIGFSRNTPLEDFEQLLVQIFREHHLAVDSVAQVATIDIKQGDLTFKIFATSHGWPIVYYSAAELNAIVFDQATHNPHVFRATGAMAVAEPAAILGAQGGNLIVRKVKSDRVTMAVGLVRAFG